MSERADESDLESSIANEVDYIRRTFAAPPDQGGAGIEIGLVPEGRGVGYMYAVGQLLVRREYLAQVEQILGRGRDQEPREAARLPGEPGEEEHVIGDVVLLRLRDGEPAVPEALAEIDRRLGPGIATPDHLLTVAGEAAPCPATEPEQVYQGIEPYPSACPGDGGTGVRIYLADTGLLHDVTHPGWLASHPWLTGVEAGDAADYDQLPPHAAGQPQKIPAYAGHGTFVAGVTRCLAPGAEIIVTNAFSVAGSTLESDLAQRLGAALGHGVDIFHLTVAAPSRHNLPMIGIAEWLRLMRGYKGTVCTVAAGNSGSRRPFWPAAFPEVVSVGALAADWRSRASFSNHGGWVDVYAPGRDLINAYASGTYTCHVWPYANEPREFYGMAKWSGTSFSTPIVTGLIAARMSRTGESGREAADALLAEARAQAIPGVGAILLPRCDGERGRPAGRCGCCCERRSCDC